MNEHLDTMVVEAATPDESTFARLIGRRRVEVGFAPGYYPYSTDERIGAKLETVARLLWTARMREYYRYKSQLLGRPIRGEGPARTDEQAARREARNQIVAVGESFDGRVRIEATGLFEWSVVLAPGTVAHTPEEEFTSSVAYAAEKLIEQHENKLAVVWATGTDLRR